MGQHVDQPRRQIVAAHGAGCGRDNILLVGTYGDSVELRLIKERPVAPLSPLKYKPLGLATNISPASRCYGAATLNIRQHFNPILAPIRGAPNESIVMSKREYLWVDGKTTNAIK